MNIYPPKWTPRQTKNNWINLLAAIHDTNCECDKPLEHTIEIILEKEKNLRFDDSTNKLLKKCLGTEDTAKDGDAVDGLDAGDLDRLFADPFGEDTG